MGESDCDHVLGLSGTSNNTNAVGETHRPERNTAKESIENKKLSEQDYMKMVDQAWTMRRAHTGLRLICHEGILEMTGNRGGECGFLRLEQMRLTDTSELALHPGAFRVWAGDDSSIVR